MVMIFSLTGNSVVFFIFTRKELRSQSTNRFFAALAISDAAEVLFMCLCRESRFNV